MFLRLMIVFKFSVYLLLDTWVSLSKYFFTNNMCLQTDGLFPVDIARLLKIFIVGP